MITYLEPDILECEVKWALESSTTNKASGSDGIPIDLFQILKDDANKVLHSVCQPIWNQSIAACPVLLLLDLLTDFSGAGQVVWYSYLFKNFPQFVVIHTIKGFRIANKA